MADRVKVRILSGNERGQVVELDRTVAETDIATGFAELYVEPPLAPVAAPEEEKPKEKKGKAKAKDE